MANIKINIDGDTSKFNGAVDGAKKKTLTLSSAVKKLRPVAVASFAALGTGALASARAFAQFENELKGVKTLLDSTSFGAKGLEKGFEKLQKDVLALGRRAPVEISSLNKALFDTISAGVDASKAVGALESATKLAVAGITDVSVATDGLTSALNAYSMDAEDAEEVAAKFFTAQKRGKTTIDQLSSSFGLAASTASSFGVSIDELLAAVSAATLGGIKTSAAFTSLNQVLANVAKPTADAKAEAKRLGIEFNSTALRTKGLSGFLKQLTEANGFTQQSVEKLFGSVEAQKVIFALTGGQAQSFASILDELGDKQKTVSTFANAFNEQNKSAANQFKILQNEVKALSIEMGAVLTPALLGSAKGSRKLLESLRGLLKTEDLDEKFSGQSLKFLSGQIDSVTFRIKQLKKELAGVGGGEGLGGGVGRRSAITAQIEEQEEKLRSLQKAQSEALQTEKDAAIESRAIQEEKTLKAKEDAANRIDIEKEKLQEEKALKAEFAELEKEIAAIRDEEILEADSAELQRLQKREALKNLTKEKARAKDLKAEGKNKKALIKLQEGQDKRELQLEQAKFQAKQSIQRATVEFAAASARAITQIFGVEGRAGFLIEKGIALAKAIVLGRLAVAQAAALPPPANVPAIAAAETISKLNIATIAATTVGEYSQRSRQGFQDGGLVEGRFIPGRDTIPAGLQPGELIVPRQRFDEVVEGYVRSKGFVQEDELGGLEIELSLKDGLMDFIEAQVLERRAAGIGVI